MVGRIVRVNQERGFGFIASEDVTGDAFFHFTALQNRDFRDVGFGEHVEFVLVRTEKGLRAENVTVL